MSKFKVENVHIYEQKIDHKSILVNKYTELIKKYKLHDDPVSLLPNTSWTLTRFELHNTTAGFANGIRRALLEEIPCQALSIKEVDVDTNDKFINGMIDVLCKNVGLIPIYQDEIKGIKKSDEDLTGLYLLITNTSQEIIDVKASDFKPEAKAKDIIPNSNIIIARLRPGKTLSIKNVRIERGIGVQDAAKFSLLRSVKYTPIYDVKPFDQFSEKGVRSIAYCCKNFALEFSTHSNIQPIDVMKLVCNELSRRLSSISDKIQGYLQFREKSDIYIGDNIEVKKDSNDIICIKIVGEYITLMNMIANKCFELDNNILHCSASVERYDTNTGILKIKHADYSIITTAIDKLIEDLDIVSKSFNVKEEKTEFKKFEILYQEKK